MSCYNGDNLYEIYDVKKKELYRLCVDGEWIKDYTTEKEALNALNKWINDHGIEGSGDGCLEYVFDEAFVCKIIKTRAVRKVK